MKSVLFFYPHINSIGGVEMAIMRLSAQLHDKFNIYIGFTQSDSDMQLLIRMSEYATIVNLQYNKMEFDVVVYCSLYCHKNIKAKKYIRWLHGCVADMKYQMKPEADLSAIVAVGQTCANQVEAQTGQKPIVIYNELDVDIFNYIRLKEEERSSDILKLVTVSRISPEKGFERMLKISKELNKANIKYVWDIVGNGYNKDYESKIKGAAPGQWRFYGKKDNPFPYIKNADFLLQLSDYEAFGYVILESLVMGTPVITTDYTSASEMVNETNGSIIKKDLSNFSIDIFNKKHIFTFNYKSGADKWIQLLK